VGETGNGQAVQFQVVFNAFAQAQGRFPQMLLGLLSQPVPEASRSEIGDGKHRHYGQREESRKEKGTETGL
jgi:hypothetical protein